LQESADLRQELAVRPAELQRAVGLSLDLIALLVNRPMVPATEHGQIRERGGPALSPVSNVMALPEAHGAAREPAPVVSMMERAP
jgi:hypothetical protein